MEELNKTVEIETAYQSQIDLYQDKSTAFSRKSNTWSIIRFLSFIVFIAAIILLFQQNIWLGIASIYLFGYFFVLIVRKHNHISAYRDKYQRIVKINENELKYLENNYTDLDEGNQYVDPVHPYSSDLDLFGDRSLYQLLIRANTIYGKDKLALRLKKPLEEKEILLNQEAIKELEGKLDWRQSFYANHLKHNDASLNQDKIDEWLNVDNAWIDKPILKVVSFVVPVITLGLAYWLISQFGLLAGFLSMVPGGLILKKYQEDISKTQDLVKDLLKYLTQYNGLFKEIETAQFDSIKLQNLKSNLEIGERTVSQKLRTLDWYLDQLDLKFNNVFGMIFNIYTLWDLHFMRLLFGWKKRNGRYLHQWLDTLGEMECLCSLANLSFNNPSWCFPTIDQNEDMISCEDIGHPLIHRNTRIGNTIDLKTEQHIKLITGSNMGGKSTFLRSVGLNLVLSYIGSTVCAGKLKAPILAVITSMRTNDALKENTSGFYAELKKLKNIVDAVQDHTTDQQHYFLIDEVLKGTNSNDRHEGSKALIKQLLNQKAAGLISTHDLKLANLEIAPSEMLDNKCFEVEVNGDQLTFDYKIKDGVSQSFNATQLMRNMGIDI